MAAKLTVQTDVGTFSRRTDRAYQYIIVCRGVRADVIEKNFADSARHLAKKAIEYQEVIDGKRPPLSAWQLSEYPGYLANVQEEQRTAAERKTAKLEAEAAKPFEVFAWSSRLDLATKEARGSRATLHNDVRIYEVSSGKRVL